MKTQASRILLALTLGLTFGIGSVALAGDRGKRSCQEEEAYCIDMCEEIWAKEEDRKDKCEEECKQDALTCKGKDKGKKSGR